MAGILNNNFFKFNLKKQREYFPRTKAFYQSDHIAAKISKIAFPIFVAGFLVLATRDSFDIASRKVHYKKPSKAQEIKEKSIQLLSKYGPAILAIGALGCASYFAYNFLNTKTIESVAKDVIPDVNDNLAQVLSNANNPVEPTCSLFEHALKHPQNLPTNTIVNPVNNDPLRQVLENQVSGPTCNPFESALQYPQDVLPPHTVINSSPLGQVLESTSRANPFQNITEPVADIINRNTTITQNIADHAPELDLPESTSTALAIIGSLLSIPFMTVGCSIATGLLRDDRPAFIEDHADLPQSQEVDHNIAGNQHPVEQAPPQGQDIDIEDNPFEHLSGDIFNPRNPKYKPSDLVERNSSESASSSVRVESASSESSSDVVGGRPVIGVHERSPPPSPKLDEATQTVEQPPPEEGVDEDDMKDGELPHLGAAAAMPNHLEQVIRVELHSPNGVLTRKSPHKTSSNGNDLSASWEEFSKPDNRPEPTYTSADRHKAIMPQFKDMNTLINYLTDKRVIDAKEGFLAKLRNCITVLNDESYRSEERRYSDFTDYLRKALKHPKDNLTPFEEGAMQTLEEVAYFRFTEGSLYRYLHDSLRQSLLVEVNGERRNDFPDRGEFEFDQLATLLKNHNRELHNKANIFCFSSIRDLFTKLRVEFGKARGASGILFDPQREFNIPYPRSWFAIPSGQGERTVIHLRHSTATHQDIVGNATPLEEYEGFLRSADSKGQRVGYFNHQDQSSGSEKERVRAIKELENNHANIDVWSLPFDGELFSLVHSVKRGDSIENLTTFALMSDKQYKKRLIDEFFRIEGDENDPYSKDQPPLKLEKAEEESLEQKSDQPALVEGVQPVDQKSDQPVLVEAIEPGPMLEPAQPVRFAIPRRFRENEQQQNELREDLTKLLDDVHRVYFNNATLANNFQRRRLMVLFFYAHLIEEMSIKQDLKFVVTACKDNKDRGGAMTAICEILRMIKTDQHNKCEQLEKLFTHVLGVGLLTKNEHVLGGRLRLLTEAIEYLSGLNEEDIQRIQAFGNVKGFGFRDDAIRPPNPFIVENRDQFDAELKNHISQQKTHESEFSMGEFDKIFSTYSNKETKALDPAKIYKQLKKDQNRFTGITVTTDNYPEGHDCKTSNELLKALELPENSDDIDLVAHDEALKFLILAIQSSGGVGSEIMLNDIALRNALERFDICIKGESGKKEDSNLSSKGEFKKNGRNGACKLEFNNSYEFFSMETGVIAKIPFRTTFDLRKRKIRYKWWIEAAR